MTSRVATPVDDIRAGVRASVGDVAVARTLPAEAYTSPAFFDFEREAVFRRSWLYLCHESQVAHPGDHLAVEAAGEPLLVTRNEAGRINVLSAVCQHRGYVLPDGAGSGRHLRCPYHFWTYDLDGRLTSAPSMAPAHAVDELRACIALPRLRSEVWHGMVFAHLDPDAAPLAPTVERLGEVLAPYRIADMVVADTVTFDELPFNWKNLLENALEEYHTTYVHKGFHENVPAHLVEHADYQPGEGAIHRLAGMVVKGGEPVPNRPTFPVIDGLPERERGYFVFAAIPPLCFLAVRPDGLKLLRVEPLAADRVRLEIAFLFPPSTLEVPGFDALMRRQLELVDLVDRPDIETNTRVYRGLRSQFAPRGPYSPQEASLPQLNQWLLERYLSAPVDAPVVREAL